MPVLITSTSRPGNVAASRCSSIRGKLPPCPYGNPAADEPPCTTRRNPFEGFPARNGSKGGGGTSFDEMK
jgi:hypothetical protein